MSCILWMNTSFDETIVNVAEIGGFEVGHAIRYSFLQTL
jgi:hypothetical protein